MNYTPLAGDEIRIIHLLPSEDHEAEIQCYLSRKFLKDFLIYRYSALSYFWGSPTPTRRISIDEAPVYVTPNLFAALQHIRDTTQTVKIWVDALCINQNDNSEKSHQVRRMKDIYAGAEAVFMWLGEEADESNLAMELLQRIEKFSKIEEEANQHLIITLTEEIFTPHWSALEKLFKRPYWTRVWIVQEVVSSSAGVMCCGKHRALWFPLMLFLNNLKRWDFERLSNGLRSFWINGSPLQMQLAKSHVRLTAKMAKISLLHGLVFFRNRKASDPRDHIYGALNLVAYNGLEPDYDKPFRILYRDVVTSVVNQDGNLDILSACRPSKFKKDMDTIQLTERFIQTMKALSSYLKASAITDSENSIGESKILPLDLSIYPDLLRACDQAYRGLCSAFPGLAEVVTLKYGALDHFRKYKSSKIPDWTFEGLTTSSRTDLQAQDTTHAVRLANLATTIGKIVAAFHIPSWTPDWRDGNIYDGLLFNNIDNCYYAASRGTKPVLNFSNDNNTMFVDGLLIDNIAAVPPDATNFGFRKKNVSKEYSLRDEWEFWSLGKQSREIYGDKAQQQEAYIYTITAGRNRDGSKGTCGLNTKTASIALDLGFIDEDEIDRIEYLETRVSQSMADYAAFLPLHYAFKFCTTKRGFMGRVHPQAEAGDGIVVFAGAKVPHVLRKYEDRERYFLVSECCKLPYLSNFCRTQATFRVH
jgi:hypothetical protein